MIITYKLFCHKYLLPENIIFYNCRNMVPQNSAFLWKTHIPDKLIDDSDTNQTTKLWII